MEHIPNELKAQIVNFVPPCDLRTLRLVSQRISHAATRKLFAHIHITPAESTLHRFQSILKSRLAHEVISLKITTCGKSFKAYSEYGFGQVPSDGSQVYQEVLNSIWQLPSLCDIEVEFSRIPHKSIWSPELLETGHFRSDVLQAVFSALSNEERPVPKLRCLSLKQFQNPNNANITSSDNCISALSRISELRLEFPTEIGFYGHTETWMFPELHTPFDPRNMLLKSAEENLTSLTLQSEYRSGFLQMFDLTTTHFPRLVKLVLRHLAFTSDDQLDWIISHSRTLESLVLDDCPIVKFKDATKAMQAVQDWMQDWGDLYSPHESSEVYRWEYPQTWANYFRRIESGLRSLNHFKFGRAQGQGRLSYDQGDGAEWESVGMFPNMYSSVFTTLQSGQLQKLRVSESRDFQEKKNWEAGDDEDDKAYRKVMAVVESRRRAL